MIVHGLDPGTTKSALVTLDTDAHCVLFAATLPNQTLLEHLYTLSVEAPSVLVLEQIESMGMAVGAEVFETVFWTGRFYEAWRFDRDRVTRRRVKLHLCGSMRAKDGNIRQALLDQFGGSAAVGTTKARGPLYGVHGHEFAALAVAVTWAASDPSQPA